MFNPKFEKFDVLTKLTCLQSLLLRDLHPTIDFDFLQKMVTLKELHLEDLCVRGTSITQLTNLECLTFSSNLAVPKLSRLNVLTNLTNLDLMGCGVSDEDLAEFTTLTALQQLKLGGGFHKSYISHTGLLELTKLPVLRILTLNSLHYIQDKELIQLGGLPALQFLCLAGISVWEISEKAIDQLQASIEPRKLIVATMHSADNYAIREYLRGYK